MSAALWRVAIVWLAGGVAFVGVWRYALEAGRRAQLAQHMGRRDRAAERARDWAPVAYCLTWGVLLIIAATWGTP